MSVAGLVSHHVLFDSILRFKINFYNFILNIFPNWRNAYFLFPPLVDFFETVVRDCSSSTGANGLTCLFSNCNNSSSVKFPAFTFNRFSLCSSVYAKQKKKRVKYRLINSIWNLPWTFGRKSQTTVGSLRSHTTFVRNIKLGFDSCAFGVDM